MRNMSINNLEVILAKKIGYYSWLKTFFHLFHTELIIGPTIFT